MELDDCIEFDGTTSELVYCSISQEPQTPVPKKKKKPSVTSSWTYSSINGLIQAVEEHPCVWEYSIPDYKDRNKREQTWRDIKESCPGHTVENFYTINFTKLYAEDLQLFQQYLRTSTYHEEISTALNEYRENLLHLSCQFNEPHHIRKLIDIKCSIFKQDFYGRTPLHVALRKNHKECIEEFEELLTMLIQLNVYNNSDKMELIESCRKMFRIYDNDGFTVLHLAVIKNQPQMVKIMLDFCLKYEINILEKEVLGSGDSILHLAVKNNFIDIKNIIIAKVKDSVNHPNYSGATPDKYCCDEEVTQEP